MGKERGKAHVFPFSPYTKHTHPDISDSSSPSWSAVTLMPRERAVFRIAVSMVGPRVALEFRLVFFTIVVSNFSVSGVEKYF